MELDKAIEQAEVKQLEMMLNVQYQKNMAFFESYDRNLHHRFKEFVPSSVKLIVDSNGSLNLKNLTEMGNLVYPSDPMQFTQEYIDQFIETPKYSRVYFDKGRVIDEEDDIHIEASNRALEVLSDQPYRNDDSTRNEYNYLHINGVGMGYIVAGFLDKVDVKNLVIFEPNDDVFYSSLFVLDWKEVCSCFNGKYRNIKIIVSDDKQFYYNELRKFFNKIGLHNIVKPHIVDHLSSKELSELTSEYLDRIRTNLSATGFFDDEQWSFAHTIDNWKSGVPPLRQHARITGSLRDVPVFLIANGPSLDAAKGFLIENRNKAIYVSCGTTISSLKKIGIKPDIHLEMERRYVTYEVLESVADPEYFKDIMMIGLNTVHPDVFGLFERNGMGMKPNDLGTHFVSQYIGKGQHCIQLGFSNPNVGNMGLSVTGALGFKNVYLFGLDLALSEEGQHHSLHSTYYDMKDEIQEEHHAAVNSDSSEIVKGNFRKTVRTKPLFKTALASAEMAVKLNRLSTYHNLSDGVYIEGAEPLNIEDLKLTEIIDRASIVDDIHKQSFGFDGLSEISSKDYLPVYTEAVKVLRGVEVLFSNEINSVKEGFEVLDDVHDYILRLSQEQYGQYVYTLIKGSMYSWNTLLAQALLFGEQENESVNNFHKISKVVVEFAKRSIVKVERSFDRIDRKELGYKNMLS